MARTVTAADVARDVKGVTLDHLNQVWAFLEIQKATRGGITLEDWALGDAIDVEARDKGAFKFRPLVRLDNGDNRIVELYNQDPNVYYRGVENIKNIPPYDTPCWGFCGAGQGIEAGRSLMGLGDRECEFVPFSVDNAAISEWNFLRGAGEWSYQVSGRTYIVSRTKDEGVFIQRSADGRLVRQVLRIPIDEAKRILIQRGILGAVADNVKPLITPLLRWEGFPVADYDRLGYSPVGYQDVVTQESVLDASYGILSVPEALAILNYYSNAGQKDNYPLRTGVKIQF